jgi:hypothetical protein
MADCSVAFGPSFVVAITAMADCSLAIWPFFVVAITADGWLFALLLAFFCYGRPDDGQLFACLLAFFCSRPSWADGRLFLTFWPSFAVIIELTANCSFVVAIVFMLDCSLAFSPSFAVAAELIS